MLTQTYDFWLWILKEKKLSKNSCNCFIDRVTALKNALIDGEFEKDSSAAIKTGEF